MKLQRAARLTIWLAGSTLIASAAVVSSSVAQTRDAKITRQSTRTKQKPGVTELRSIDQLQDKFRQDRGKVRLVVLISPT